MDSEIVDWVNSIRKEIAGKVWVYRKYAPYDLDDYLQDAYESAVIAAKICPRIGDELYRRIFWRLFKDAIAEIVPWPEGMQTRTNLSMSVPLSLYADLDEQADLTDGNLSDDPKDLEEMYQEFSASLTERQSEILFLRLGLSDRGRLSHADIAKTLNLDRSTVRLHLKAIRHKAGGQSHRRRTGSDQVTLEVIATN